MNSANLELVKAFPKALQDDALKLASALPDPSITASSFPVEVGSNTVWIPYRIYHDPAQIDSKNFSQAQYELLACLLTRHHNGFVRAEFLAKILDFDHEWVPPFVVQLAGEYVVEIARSIRDNLDRLRPEIYREFLRRNPAFYQTTKKRVTSYWNCYHRGERREDYAGFQVVEFFDGLIAGTLK